MVSVRVSKQRKHTCTWMYKSPGICVLVKKVATAWLVMQDGENITKNEVQRITEEGEEAKTIVLTYIDWLVTTFNKAPPDQFSHIPIPHPCSVSPCIATNQDKDCCQLVNTMQWHTHCSTSYCLRRKPGQQELICRFKYPLDQQPSSTINFEQLDNGILYVQLYKQKGTTRNLIHTIE